MSVLTNKQDLASFLTFLRCGEPKTAGKWGKMNFQQMVEHLSDSVRQSFSKEEVEVLTPAERLAAMQEFIRGGKSFRENTINPTLPPVPLPLRHATLAEAVDELERNLESFHLFFGKSEELKTIHPIFGELTLTLWLSLHDKHFTHHARQFQYPI